MPLETIERAAAACYQRILQGRAFLSSAADTALQKINQCSLHIVMHSPAALSGKASGQHFGTWGCTLWTDWLLSTLERVMMLLCMQASCKHQACIARPMETQIYMASWCIKQTCSYFVQASYGGQPVQASPKLAFGALDCPTDCVPPQQR